MFCIVEKECQIDSDCPSQTGCINALCVNPCDASSPCGTNSKCKILDTFPIRTMICECLPGTQGNAAIRCDEGIYSKLFTEKLPPFVIIFKKHYGFFFI